MKYPGAPKVAVMSINDFLSNCGKFDVCPYHKDELEDWEYWRNAFFQHQPALKSHLLPFVAVAFFGQESAGYGKRNGRKPLIIWWMVFAKRFEDLEPWKCW